MSSLEIGLYIAGYFGLLVLISRLTSGKGDNASFFTGGRSANWVTISFGMIGASLSGVTFISVPGMVAANQFSYMQMVLGYIVGYLLISTVLLPLYYRLDLTSIYTYLRMRFGPAAYRTGASFFILSRVIGAAFRLFLVAIVFEEFIFDHQVAFPLIAFITIGLIWIYTFKGGIKTIIWTDTLQTTFMLVAVVMTIWGIAQAMGLSLTGVIDKVAESDYSQVFFTGDSISKKYFIKQFLSGAAIALVMTGLDQDMMQKNLACRNLKDAQKNVMTLSIVLVFVNLLFLGLGALLYIHAAEQGIAVPDKPDLLFATIALEGGLGKVIGVAFILGLVASAYSSADSALTALTTSFYVDILGAPGDRSGAKVVGEGIAGTVGVEGILNTGLPEIEGGLDTVSKATDKSGESIRRKVHLGMSGLLWVVIVIFYLLDDESVIKKIFTVAGYTYGPLLGLYAFGLFTKIKVRDELVPLVCVLSPIICYLLATYVYDFGFELLILNGAITFLGLLLISKSAGASGTLLDKTEVKVLPTP